jgi:hypothetical protein
VGYYEESGAGDRVIAAGRYIYECRASQRRTAADPRLAPLVTTVTQPVDLYLHTDDPTPGAALGNAFFDSNPPTATVHGSVTKFLARTATASLSVENS